jgi:hypothetical protein
MSILSELIRDLKIALIFQEEFDPNQPRDADGRFAEKGSRRKTIGPVGQYKGLDPKHLERIITARDQAVDNAARKARNDVLSAHGFDPWYNLSGIPKEVEDEAREAEFRIRGSELTKEKESAEEAERSAIDNEYDEDRVVRSATKAGHLLPVPAEKLDKAKEAAKVGVETLGRLSDDLHQAQDEAAKAIRNLINYSDVDAVDEDGDPIVEDPLDDSSDLLGQLGELRTGVLGIVNKLKVTAAGGSDSKEKEIEDYDYSDPDHDIGDSESIPELPEYPDDLLDDPSENVDEEELKDPGSLEEFADENGYDLEDKEESQQAQKEHQIALDNAKHVRDTYTQDKKDYDDQQKQIKHFEAEIEKRKSAQVVQAGKVQKALEKVYTAQTAVGDYLKKLGPDLDKKIEDAQEEVPASEDLVNDKAFDNKPRDEDTEELADEEDQKDYMDAQAAAEVVSRNEFSAREAMGVDFEDAGENLKETKKTVAKAIKQLAIITNIPLPSSLGAKAKTKAKKKAISDDEDDDE